MKSVSPSDLSGIQHEFLITSVSELYEKVLIARFTGSHRPGAEGAPDTRLIQAFTDLGLDLWIPEALILDFSGLAYPGGPMLHPVMTAVEPDLEEGFPFYVVTGTENRAALEEALPAEAMVDSLEEALEKVRKAGPWALR